MLDYVTLDDANGVAVSLHGAATRALVSADGLVGLPGVRSVVRNRPNGHGSINRTRRKSDRVISLAGEVWGSSQAAAYAELDALEAALDDAVDTDRLLKWRRGQDGLELQAAVRTDSDLKVPLKGGGRFLTWAVQLRASDPRAYSQRVYVATSPPMSADGGGFSFPVTFPAGWEAGSGGQAVYTNEGTAATAPVYRIHGQVTDPQLLLPDGSRLVLSGSVAAGDFLELDVAQRTVTLNGGANRQYMLVYGASRWAELPKGTGTVQMIAASYAPDAYLEVFYRHAFN